MNKDINLTDGTVTEVLNNKVDIDFGNVPSNSVSFARCSTEVTNCITEIPQRIKLELNNGTLTLKAGSKVIVPNGFEEDGTTPKFDYVNIEEDLSISKWGTDVTNTCVLGLRKYEETLKFTTMMPSTLFSGSTKPTPNVGEWWEWYDTVNNKINYTSNNGTSYDSDYCSFPFAITKVVNSIFTSIDQTFNGMGYIGSTIWVDKGVKVLIPNGRNADGTLNNIEFETSKVSICEIHTNLTSLNNLVVFNGEIHSWGVKNYTYDKDKNLFHWFSNDEYYSICELGSFYGANGVISNFQPKQPFRALDYNDKPEISGWAMPSRRFIDLTLGASGASYTAPANGWVVVRKTSSGSGQNLIVGQNITDFASTVYSSASGQILQAMTPVSKNSKIYVAYTVGGKTNSFKFYYTEGEV